MILVNRTVPGAVSTVLGAPFGTSAGINGLKTNPLSPATATLPNLANKFSTSERDDPRSIFFSGSSTPLRSYAGSDLFKRTSTAAGTASQSTSPTPSTSSTSPTTSTPAAESTKPEPVVRIIPILYPAQPARLIGGTSSYGNTNRPNPTDGSDVENAPVKGSEVAATPPPSPPTTSAAPVTTGILKSPLGTPPAGGSGTPSRVSFSARPTTSKPTMAGPSGTNPSSVTPSGTSNGVHGRTTLPLAKASRSVEPPLPPSIGGGETTPHVPHPPEPGPGTGGSACRMQLALYGWRKKCLYALIFILMVMIIVNLALTLWIMKVMEFSSNGMGQLKIVPGGIQLTGQALVLNTLRASSIRSKHGQPISVESSRNLSVNTRNAYGAVENQLFLGHDRLEVLANHFRITDTHGTDLFAVDRDEVIVGADSLRVAGDGGVAFRDSIQTPLVQADAGKDLMLESPTRSLEARATQEIFIQSRAGGIEATCLNDLKLHSVAGSIRLDSSAIYMPNLKTVQTVGGTSGGLLSGSNRADSAGKIYQLCACSSGKLFLAAPNSVCTADDSAICR